MTARRCLLAGVLIFPVTAPLVTSGKDAFPRVRALTRLLRWNPLALDIADSLVRTRSISVEKLAAFLEQNGVAQVHAIEHEDDLPEVRLLVAWAWERLSEPSRRLLSVLAYVEGDHVDLPSLARLAELRQPERALAPLTRWHLLQEPRRGRYTLHAVVRHALRKRCEFSADRIFEHYVSLLEREPARLAIEQTHLFAAMDHAYRANNFPAILRVEHLLQRLDPESAVEAT
jgi:hypothetical protein